VDLVVDGLAAGAPLDVVLKACIVEANLLLGVHAPPLPPSLTPLPTRVIRWSRSTPPSYAPPSGVRGRTL
jgi:hypothetical protein